MDLSFLSSFPLWAIIAAIVLFIVGFKVGKMILWGLAILAVILAVWFGVF